jgi:hypothetical protein
LYYFNIYIITCTIIIYIIGIFTVLFYYYYCYIHIIRIIILKESEIMNMKNELMNDTVDDVLEDPDQELETEEVVSKVLDELGLTLEGEVQSLPSSLFLALLLLIS